MKKIVYLLLIFITACGGDIVSDSSTSSNGSGIYTALILSGDYVEKPATSIVLNSNSFSDNTNTLIELAPNASAFVEAKLQPVSVKNASFLKEQRCRKKIFLPLPPVNQSCLKTHCLKQFTINHQAAATILQTLNYRQIKMQLV